ncbi:hypothetical protein FMEXI_13626 [Fusarium mexicanum]|uniref:Uncharacterized protein n=1 Tax=Fusarium mexicanum TaxID=751941 RepID=A0A8H5I4N6_9HYPO|nr:hypothetical protein FMEXI_13626 [Fusarium mexicanum]
MLTNWFLQLAILTAATLPRLATAGSDVAAPYGSAAIPTTNLPVAVSNASSTIEHELLLEECDPTISVCRTTADIKVIRTHKSTSTSTTTRTHVTTIVRSPLSTFDSYIVLTQTQELPTSYRTIVEVIVSTTIIDVEGQCRDTIIYEELDPTTVTVEVNTTTTREFVPIVPTTVKTTSWVPHTKISQCIVKRTSTGLAPGPGSSSAPPAPRAPPKKAPPAGGSHGNYNSGQPAPSIPPAGASSDQGSGRQSSAPFTSSEESSSISESTSGSDSGASGASASSIASGGASNASGASSSTSSSSSRSSAWF